MSTYEAMSLMIAFGILFIKLIAYLDRHNKRNRRNKCFFWFAGALVPIQASLIYVSLLTLLTFANSQKITAPVLTGRAVI
ncbi:hypothetical protein I5677_03575 [Mobilitalea sibirica]|uniref:Uncharacterized protein n=1 Tax=Mobilitalea sibirica TaxID=1462919 RepID=A0A8J7H1G0_9FIRM|nr:putative holin-like toxin [Mobilitalea sibirica]MBH1939975.1 hypothetical protein [Mobilitalea sibirica]